MNFSYDDTPYKSTESIDTFDITKAVDDNINNYIGVKDEDVENAVKSEYDEETLGDIVDGNVIKAYQKVSSHVALELCLWLISWFRLCHGLGQKEM